MTIDESLVHLASSIVLLVSHLHFDITRPSFLIRLPRHPSLEDLSCSSHVAEHLLEEAALETNDVSSRNQEEEKTKQHLLLIPNLINSRKESDGTVEQVASMRNVTGFELLQAGRDEVSWQFGESINKSRQTISVYDSHSLMLVGSTSSARSKTDRDLFDLQKGELTTPADGGELD